MLCSMDDRIGKHLANSLRTNAQRTTANNNPVGGIEELLLSGVVLLLLLSTTKRVRMTNLKIILPSPSLWLDLTTIKQRRDWIKLFHDGDIIYALMSPSGNKSLHVVMSMKMLTSKLLSLSSTETPWRSRFHLSPSPSPERRRR